MHEGLISIIIPTFNRAQFIGEAIQSVIDQTQTGWEIIVVDDGSTDNTEAVVKTFQDERIQFHFCEHTGSISRLRNYGIKRSRGIFIAFLDSDDIWLPRKLEIQIDLFKKFTKAGFAFSHAEQFGPGAVPPPVLPTLFVGDVLNAQLIEERFVLYPTTFMFRRETVRDVGILDEDFSGGESEFILRAASRWDGIFIGEILAKLRKHSQNVSLEREMIFSYENIQMLKKFLKLGIINKAQYNSACSKQLYKVGLLYQRRGVRLAACKTFMLYISLNPFNFKAYFRILQSAFIIKGSKPR
ncbi:MAG TPA: glycosyltransferase family A protein [Chryseolinea sp.]|nr:glycosyltransferase family A protein [Chryseolinea sp.]